MLRPGWPRSTHNQLSIYHWPGRLTLLGGHFHHGKWENLNRYLMDFLFALSSDLKIQIIVLKRHCFVNVLAFRQRLCLLLKVAKFRRYLLSIMFHGICYMLGIQRQGSWSQDTYCVPMDVTQQPNVPCSHGSTKNTFTNNNNKKNQVFIFQGLFVSPCVRCFRS